MNPIQFLKFALGGLWRQKVRTALTLVGVTVGTCALAFSLALGLGLRAFIDKEFKGRDDFWRVLVRVDEPPPDENAIPERDKGKIAVTGEMSAGRRARLREALLDRYQATRPPTIPKLLTPDRIDAIAHLPGVAEVRTFRTGDGRLWADSADKPASASVTSGPLEDLAPRLLTGRLPESPDADEVVISEFALYQLGMPDDADLHGVLGMRVRLDVGGVKNAQSATLARVLLGSRPPEELTRGQMQALEKLTAALPGKIDAFGLSVAEKLELAKLLEPPAEPRRSVRSTLARPRVAPTACAGWCAS